MDKTVKTFLIAGIASGVLIGMMTEQIIAVVTLAAVTHHNPLQGVDHVRYSF